MFGRKGDWKRHEESLHEPQKQWCCFESGCNRKFTAGNKFRHHHKTDHGCENCKHDTDAAVISTGPIKSAWGCGFCITILTTWDERAKHIGRHFDDGSKRSDWDFSRVIQGLLRQPKLFDAWQSLLRGIHGPSENEWPRFEWSMESSQELLKCLQYQNPKQNAGDIVQSAYNVVLPNHGVVSDAPGPYNDLNQSLASATEQGIPMDRFESNNSLTTYSNALIKNEDFQKVKPLFALPMMLVEDNAGAYDTLLSDCHVAEEYFQDSKDYTTPCSETFEPTAWTLWPYTDELVD
jgi:hypothetical protein